MSASAYARLVPKANRARKLPKINRPMRPRMIAWAGPAAFYPNRFYEIDRWYKARIDKPQKMPHLHIIDPTEFSRSMEEIMRAEEVPAIDIGFAKRPEVSEVLKSAEQRTTLEKKARKNELLIDMECVGSRNITVFKHFKIFDHLFGAGTFFNIVQELDVAFGDNAVYSGNVIPPADAAQEPQVKIESVKAGGFNTLLMVNIDGNPYEKEGEMVHWMVRDIPDGCSVKDGKEVVPYLQPVPFKGTGYHRVAFLLFRHETPLEGETTIDSCSLDGRLLSVSKWYQQNESQLTPSSLSFFQTSYDLTCKETLHKLGLTSPLYEYEYNEALKPPQREFPHKPMPFDLYLDMYRDPKETEQELLEERLRRAQLDDYEAPKWLDPNYNDNKRHLPAWQHAKLMARNGRYSALYGNAIKD